MLAPKVVYKKKTGPQSFCPQIDNANIICPIQHFEAVFLKKVILKILNSGITMKSFTHA